MNPIAIYDAQKRAHDAKRELINIRTRLKEYVASLEDIKLPDYTGWHVLLADDPDSESGYKFVGFFNPDVSTEDSEPEWSLALPIATNDSIKEFLGW